MILSVLNYSELLFDFELVMKTSKLTELGYFRHILTHHQACHVFLSIHHLSRTNSRYTYRFQAIKVGFQELVYTSSSIRFCKPWNTLLLVAELNMCHLPPLSLHIACV